MHGNIRVSGGPVSPNPGTDWRAIGTGDFNKDGNSDILWQNTNTSQIRPGTWTVAMSLAGDPLPPILERHGRRSEPAIFNQDGFADILLQNKNTGAVSVWEMNNNTLIGGGPVANPGTSWHAIGTGADGADILLQTRAAKPRSGR
jgi:hypothetical protein